MKNNLPKQIQKYLSNFSNYFDILTILLQLNFIIMCFELKEENLTSKIVNG